MSKKHILITGAFGEIGHSLLHYFKNSFDCEVVAVDIREPRDAAEISRATYLKGSVLDGDFINKLATDFTFDTVFHLAAILSTGGEKDPQKAHQVNTGGTFNLLELARQQSARSGKALKFIFPSTIAAYGIRDLATKNSAGAVKEDQFLNPITMYGINKLYCERLGEYYSHHFKLLSPDSIKERIDFRAVRFPGIISSQTLPSGGTSDYCPEMFHSSAAGRDYESFVGPQARIPFMMMPDAVAALVLLSQAERHSLKQLVYNVTSFSLSAQQIKDICVQYFPGSNISFKGGNPREGIVNSWPADIDDSAARRDWNWKPHYELNRALEEYLIPSLRQRYS